jgi:hypothetical protein
VPNKNNRLFDERGLRRASWLALLSLAWLQLALVTHQFEHVAAYRADACHVCVQLDRIHDAVVDQPGSLPGSPGGHVETRRPAATVATTIFVRHFDSRAPPAI